MTYVCIVFVRARGPVCVQVSSFSRSGDKNGVPKRKSRSPSSCRGGIRSSRVTMSRGFPRMFIPNSILICSAVFHSEAELRRVTDSQTDRLMDGWTDWRTDTAHVGNNRLHLMHCIHLMQPNNIRYKKTLNKYMTVDKLITHFCRRTQCDGAAVAKTTRVHVCLSR